MASKTTVPYRVALWFLLGGVSIYIATSVFHVEWSEKNLTASLAILFVLYMHHYFSNFAKLPAVFCKQGTLLEGILKNQIPILSRPYRPPLWCAESRFQTIVRALTPVFSNVKWQREVVEGARCGRFCIEWYHNEKSARFLDPETRPTVVIVPGVASTQRSSYMISLTKCLADCGYRVMVLIYRGLGDMELQSPKTYSATYTDDLEQSLQLIQERYPRSQTYAVAVSLGTLILGRYLSEKGHDCGLRAGMLLCCPFYPPDCARNMDSWGNRLLINMHVARALKRNYRRNSQVFESIVEHEKVTQITYLRDFDHHFTSPVFGYESVDEYYEDAALSAERLNDIKIPLLCVGANDDPFSPERALPKENIANTENIALVMTYGGGHVSHLQMFFPFTKSYYEHIVEEYLDAFTKS